MPTSQEDNNVPASIHPPVGKNLDKVKDGDDDDVTDDEDNKDDGDEDDLEGQKDGNEKDDREDDGERDCGDAGDAGDIRLSGVLLYCFIFSSLVAMFPHPTACPLQQSRHISLQPPLLQHLTIQLQCIQALQVPRCIRALQLPSKWSLQHLHTLQHLSIPFSRHRLHFYLLPPVAIHSISFNLHKNFALWGLNWT